MRKEAAGTCAELALGGGGEGGGGLVAGPLVHRASDRRRAYGRLEEDFDSIRFGLGWEEGFDSGCSAAACGGLVHRGQNLSCRGRGAEEPVREYSGLVGEKKKVKNAATRKVAIPAV